VSARVDNTAFCSADITKRLPTQTSVPLPPLNTGLTKGAAVATSYQVFCRPEQRPIPCVLCQLLFVGLKPRPRCWMSRQVSPLEDRRWVSLCSSVQLGHGDIQGIQPFLHSFLAAHRSNALPFVVAGEVVQDRVEESHGYMTTLSLLLLSSSAPPPRDRPGPQAARQRVQVHQEVQVLQHQQRLDEPARCQACC
jgi:hypothetical protein